MGCAASAEGTQTTHNVGRGIEESPEKRDQKANADTAGAPSSPLGGGAQPNAGGDQAQVVAPPPVKAPDTNPTPSAATVIAPQTIAGYPVNTYTDGTTRVAVKCVILSRQKCESVCRFLDSVRKARDRNGGYFRNPEEPIEVDLARREIDTASAASGRSKLEPSMSAVHNNSVTGNGMNVSMAVHVGQAEALSPSPHGGLATVPDINSGNTPARNNHRQERTERKPDPEPSTQQPPPQQQGNPGDGVGPSASRQDAKDEPIPGSVDVDGAM